MERDEFFDAAVGQAMPDKMTAVLRRNPDEPPERAFSVEGFESVGYQLHDFVLARTLAFMNREGRPPNAVRAELRLVWDDESTDDELEATEMSPWYAVTDRGTEPTTVDGETRLSAFLTERRLGK